MDRRTKELFSRQDGKPPKQNRRHIPRIRECRGWFSCECSCGARSTAGRAGNGAGFGYLIAGLRAWYEEHTAKGGA